VSNINFKKWFDRMQPQTLQIATWLLYFDGFFALIDLLDGGGEMYYLRLRYTGGLLIGLVVVCLYAGGGLLMANERRLGYRLSVAAAISPFVINFVAYSDVGASLRYRLFGSGLISFAFNVALLALLLHPQSKEHQRIWFR
jgi:hypothetical protein